VARSATLTLEGAPGNIRVARHFATRLADLLAPEGRELGPSDVQALALMVSELVSNAVEHGEGTVQVCLRTEGDRLRVEIVDGSDGQPVRRYAMPGALSGRGLEIVDRLAHAWGWEPVDGGGKLVWFEW
jgi:anti-sigma regulatory factor (Ser/Thr protein kinase)